MEMTTLKQLIDFNDKLISENGNEMTAYEIHQKVMRKAAELLEQGKEIIETAYEAEMAQNPCYQLLRLSYRKPKSEQ